MTDDSVPVCLKLKSARVMSDDVMMEEAGKMEDSGYKK